MDRHTPGDGDLRSECWHGGVECELNIDSEGNPECRCPCDDCELPYAYTEEERARDEADNDLDRRGLDRNEAPW